MATYYTTPTKAAGESVTHTEYNEVKSALADATITIKPEGYEASGITVIDGIGNVNGATLKTGGTQVVDSSRNANFTSLNIGGTNVISSAWNGNFKTLFGGAMINANWYATGQDALNACPSGGGVVYFPTGTYTVAAGTSWSVPYSNMLIFGDGDSTIIKRANSSGSTVQLFKVQAKNNVHFKYLKLDGNKANNVGASNHHGILFQGASAEATTSGAGCLNCSIDHVTTVGGMSAYLQARWGCKYIKITNCDCSENEGEPILIRASEYCTVANNTCWAVTTATQFGSNLIGVFTRTSGTPDTVTASFNTVANNNCYNALNACINNENSINTIISGNSTSGPGKGIYVTGTSYGVAVTGNTCADHNTHGIETGSSPTHITISGNTVKNCTGRGIKVDSDDTVISGNIIRDIDNDPGISSQNNTRVTISGNYVSGCTNSTNGDGILLNNCSNIAVTGNYSYNNARNGIRVSGWDGGADKVTIQGNFFDSNAANGIEIGTSDNGGRAGTNVTIVGNHCNGNTGYGLKIANSSNYVIYDWNNFRSNGSGGISTTGNANGIAGTNNLTV